MKTITPEEAERRLNGEGNLATKFRPSHHPVASREEALARWEERKRALESEVEPAPAAEVEVVETLSERAVMNDDERYNVVMAALASGKSQAEIAREFGLSESAVSRLVRGERGSAELQQRIDQSVGRISDAAIDRILAAVNVITDEKLQKSSPKEAASVAKDLTTVVEKISNRNRRDPSNTKVILVRPQMGELDDYEVVQIEAS